MLTEQYHSLYPSSKTGGDCNLGKIGQSFKCRKEQIARSRGLCKTGQVILSYGDRQLHLLGKLGPIRKLVIVAVNGFPEFEISLFLCTPPQM